VAVNVNDAPEQAGFVPPVCKIETEGVTVAFIVIVIPFDVAVAGLAHAALEVKTHVTDWPFVIVVEVKLELFVPAFKPFTFH
jgi:hypothetical protein